jgi:hypothetical protein
MEYLENMRSWRKMESRREELKEDGVLKRRVRGRWNTLARK